MRFTLVYQGDLPPKAGAAEKWRIRRFLEPQMRRLWGTPPLKELDRYQDPDYQPGDCYVGRTVGEIEFVPLISPKLDLRAELDVLFLSGSLPGGVIESRGDIDNRLKTLFDALSIPTHQQMLPTFDREADGRVFCLLDDDRFVTRIDVSNDRWLSVEPTSRDCTVIIRVQPKAFRVTTANLGITG